MALALSQRIIHCLKWSFLALPTRTPWRNDHKLAIAITISSNNEQKHINQTPQQEHCSNTHYDNRRFIAIKRLKRQIDNK